MSLVSPPVAELSRALLIRCHECDLLQSVGMVPPDTSATCSRCGATLFAYKPHGFERAFILYLAALLLLLTAPQRWTIKGEPPSTPAIANQRMAKWVERGLRGQLQSGNLLTGQRIVALQVFPDSPKAALTYEDNIPVIPTVPSDIQVLSDKVNAFLDKP